MSNKGEIEAGRERLSAARVLATARLTRSGRVSDSTARKCCAAPVSCSLNKNKKPEEPSGAAKKATVVGVAESEPRKSGTKPVTSSVWKATDHKRTSVGLGQKEAGGQEKAQVTRSPRIGKQPSPTAKKTEEKTASPQQVWREKAKPESADRIKLSAKIQQLQPPGGTTKKSSETTDSSPSTSKLKKSAIPKKVERKEPLPSPSPKEQSSKGKQVQKKETVPKKVERKEPSPSHKEQSSKGKQVQKKETGHKASTSRSYLEPDIYRYHIKWDGFDEPDNQIGVCCSLCEEDLGIAPDGMGDYYGMGDYNREAEFSMIPVVAILHCGHSFHYVCLNLGDLEGQQGDPPCVFCESFI